MKYYNLYLIRHGESESNQNKKVLLTKPDNQLELTNRGKQQIENAIKFLPSYEWCSMFVSPYVRTRQSADIIREQYKKNNIQYFERLEDPRIREIETATRLGEKQITDFSNKDFWDYGRFFYRMDTGESIADVYDRVSSFINSLHIMSQMGELHDNIVVVTHALTMRVFKMIIEKDTVENFYDYKKPINAEVWRFDLKLLS